MPDRETDGRTDRILIAIPRLHYMQRGKNLYFNLLMTCRELQTSTVSSRSRLAILTSRLCLVSAGDVSVSAWSRSREVSVSVSSPSRASTSLVTDILSCTVSELSQLIVQISHTEFLSHPLGLRDNVRCSPWAHWKARRLVT